MVRCCVCDGRGLRPYWVQDCIVHPFVHHYYDYRQHTITPFLTFILLTHQILLILSSRINTTYQHYIQRTWPRAMICGHVSSHSKAQIKKLMQAQTMHLHRRLVFPIWTGQEKQISEWTDEIQVSAPRNRGSLKSGRISIFHRSKDFRHRWLMYSPVHYPSTHSLHFIFRSHSTPGVLLHSTRFKIEKFYVVFTLHLCVLHGFKNIQQLYSIHY